MRSTVARRRRRVGVAWAMVCVAAGPMAAQQGVVREPTAPAVAALRSAVEEGRAGALAQFWAGAAEAGTPLVEADTAHAGHSLVTFLYRAADEGEEVALASNLVSLDPEGAADPAAGAPFERLGGTDVRYLTLRLRNDLRAPYRLRVTRRGAEPELVLDPLNGAVWEPEQTALRSSVVELPGALRQPWRGAGAERGDWDELTLADAAGGERTVYVYKPVGWRRDATRRYPALVGLGAFGTGIGMRVDWMADRLIEAGRIPPMVFLLLSPTAADEAARYTATDAFVVDVVLPYAREHYGISDRPEDIAVSGTSRRGMVAALMALRQPEAIGKVISLSGSYYWRPEGEDWLWVPSVYARAPRAPVRLYVAAGELETFVTPTNRGHYLLATNRRFRDVLRARGYDHVYLEFNGVHSELNWQDWLADGLGHFFGRSDR